MVVLLTGATGFLGTAVARRLARSHEVIALHRRGAPPPPEPGITWVRQDLTEPLRDLPHDFDVAVHLAHSRSPRSFPEDAEDVTLVNVLATVRLLDLCRRRGARFVYGSSGAVYAPGPSPLHEEDTPDPQNFYGDSKVAGERALLRFADLVEVSALRFFFIYGPGQSGGFMADLVDRVRSGRPVRLGGRDGIRVNPVFLDEAAAAVELAASGAVQGVCNVAGPETRSLRELAEMIGARVGRRPRFESQPASGDLVASVERCREHGLARCGLGPGLEAMLREAPALRSRRTRDASDRPGRPTPIGASSR